MIILLNSFFRKNRNDEFSIIALALGIKIILFAYGWAVFHILAPTFPIDGWRASLEIWNRWDAPHYLYIAQFGYPPPGEMKF